MLHHVMNTLVCLVLLFFLLEAFSYRQDPHLTEGLGAAESAKLIDSV